MVRLWTLIAGIVVFGSFSAEAEDAADPVAPTAPAPAATEDEDEHTVTVYGDNFARWDNTRWLMQTELGLPTLLTLNRDENLSFQTRLFQVRVVLGCNKDWRLGRNRFEVDCVIEDFAILSVPAKNAKAATVQTVLDEVDSKLTQAHVQLQVTADGRVVNTDLEGISDTGSQNRRTADIVDTLRLVMGSLMDGFDMKLRKVDRLASGQWVEYQSALMTVPMFSGTAGSSLVVNQLDTLDGHLVVQTKGRGMLANEMGFYDAKLEGVSIYDEDEGYMIERVYALFGSPTASNLSGGGQSMLYRAGRIRQLGRDDHPDVGRTGEVAPPGEEKYGVPGWKSIEGSDERKLGTGWGQ